MNWIEKNMVGINWIFKKENPLFLQDGVLIRKTDSLEEVLMADAWTMKGSDEGSTADGHLSIAALGSKELWWV